MRDPSALPQGTEGLGSQVRMAGTRTHGCLGAELFIITICFHHSLPVIRPALRKINFLPLIFFNESFWSSLNRTLPCEHPESLWAPRWSSPYWEPVKGAGARKQVGRSCRMGRGCVTVGKGTSSHSGEMSKTTLKPHRNAEPSDALIS